MESLQELSSHIALALGDQCYGTMITHGQLTLEVRRNAIQHVIGFLRDDEKCKFRLLVDIAGVDYPSEPERFAVVYHLLSHTHNTRIRVKLFTDALSPVPSIVALHPSAGWYEREAWDLYGILFDGNPDLRRILTDYGFDGHPLRKDFPLTGYVELRYDPEKKAVVYEPVSLPQAYRNFDYQSPWEGAKYVLPGDEKAG